MLRTSAVAARAAVGVVALSAAAACSSGGSGGIGGGSITTSVSGSKTLDSLTTNERTQWCHDIAAYYTQQITSADVAKSRCYSKAVSASFSTQNVDERRQKCTDAYSQCVSQPPTDSADNSAAIQSNCEQSKTFAQCRATVSQMNTCLADEISQTKSVYATYDSLCSAIGSDAGLTSSVSREEPESCKTVESMCPGLSSKDSATTSDAPASGG